MMQSPSQPEAHIQAFFSSLNDDIPIGMNDSSRMYYGDPFAQLPMDAAKPVSPAHSSRSSTVSDSGSGSNSDSGFTQSRSSSGEVYPAVGTMGDSVFNEALANNLRMVQQQRHQDRSERSGNRKRDRQERDQELTAVSNPPLEELLEEADLKRKRLARKAELARLSRKRKKTRVSELESEVAQLKEELSRERAKVTELENERLKRMISSSQGENSSTNLDDRLKAKFLELCQVPLEKASANPAVVQTAVQDFVDAYKSKSACNGLQMAGFEKSFSSCVATNFVRWVLNQGDRFYNVENPSGLWSSLFKSDLGCSPEQLQKFLDLRTNIQGKLREWSEVETAFRKLSPLMRSYFNESAATLESFVSLMTPAQSVQFFQWVDKFGEVCVKINV